MIKLLLLWWFGTDCRSNGPKQEPLLAQCPAMRKQGLHPPQGVHDPFCLMLSNPYSWNLLFSFITSTVPLQAIIVSCFPLLLSSIIHGFFLTEIFFFSEKLQSKFQSRKTKASLETERVIIASGMEDRRKCQIKGLNFKKQQRKTGKGEDENKVHQISKIMNQLLPNQTLSSVDPGAPCLFIWCFASCDSRLHSWKFYGSKVSAWKEAGRLQRESGELGMHEKMTGAKRWSDYGQWCLKMIL